MFAKFKKFRSDENGAVTVDWVVLTAAVVMLAVGLSVVLGTTDENGTTGILATLKTTLTDAIAKIN